MGSLRNIIRTKRNRIMTKRVSVYLCVREMEKMRDRRKRNRKPREIDHRHLMNKLKRYCPIDNDLDRLWILTPMKPSLPYSRYSLFKVLALPPTLIRPLGLCTQAFQLGITITFVKTFLF
jgi:hypothetical protein